MNIEIKERKLPSGSRSLYLEYYETGFRKKESLGLFLLPDDAPGAKKHNKEVCKRAAEIRADRLLHPAKLEECKKDKEVANLTWLEWCDQYIQWSIDCNNCKKAIDHKNLVRRRIEQYLTSIKATKLRLKDVTSKHITGLYDYMRFKYRNPGQIKENGGKLSDFTLLLFGETVNAIFNKAVRDGLITANPVQGLSQIEKFHAPDKHREFLTAEEFLGFIQVETATDQEWQVQHAFGFSCMTGLRLSDIRNLRWSNIKTVGDVQIVSVIQQKTKSPVIVPLNEMALSLLPERPDTDEDGLIFHLSNGHGAMGMYVRRIKERAGIGSKHLTYHCSRHTAATLAITAGAELYSVSKILGHKSIVSTQVYADVQMETKIDAVNLANGVFD